MYNKIILIGRLGKDPEIRKFSESSAIAEFPIATTENYKDKEGKWVEVTDWHNIKLPNKFMADRAEKSLKKGSMVFIEGKSKTRSFDDKDGNKRYITEVIAEIFRLLDKKDESTSSSNETQQQESKPSTNQTKANTNSSNSGAIPEDDLPF